MNILPDLEWQNQSSISHVKKEETVSNFIFYYVTEEFVVDWK